MAGNNRHVFDLSVHKENKLLQKHRVSWYRVYQKVVTKIYRGWSVFPRGKYSSL